MRHAPFNRHDTPRPPADAPKTILFVCLGNMIRSPLAEALAKRLLAERGLAARYRIRSAGTIAGHGYISPPEAVRVGAENGLDIKPHLTTPLSRDLVEEADLVIAVDRSVAEQILDLVPDLGPRLKLLTQFASMPGVFDVPDPIGESRDVYEEAFRRIDAGVRGLVEALAARAADLRSGPPS